MVGLLRSGLETSGILKTDGLIIMDWGGYIWIDGEDGIGCGERSMAGSGVTKKPGHSSGVMPVATGSTCSFVFLKTDTGSKANRSKII